MPYLKPDRILERFSKFALEEVRPEIDDDFLHGQVGSMASTLRFLSMELAGRADAVERQREALRTALEELAASVDDETVASTAEAAGERIAEASDEDPEELETALLEASNEVLAAIDEELTGAAARRARAPVYEFLEVRVQSQLELMGRQSE